MIDQANVRRQFGDMFQKYFPGQNQDKMFDEEAVKMGYGGQNIEQSQLDDYFRQRVGAGAPPSPVTMERSAPQVPITPERSAPQIPNYVAPPPIMERSAPQVPISMQPSTPQTPISSMVQPQAQPQMQPQVKPAQTNWLSPSPSVMSQQSNSPTQSPGADTSMSNQLLSGVRKSGGLSQLPSWFK